MTCRIGLAWSVFLGFAAIGSALAADDAEKAADITFGDVKFFLRHTKDDMTEYTPHGQDDLKAWKDMVTINRYRKAKDGDALAQIANNMLELYKANGARIIRTGSIPKTDEAPAEHLIVAFFGRPEFIEVAFARLKMHEGVGTSVVYSRRVYGEKVGNAASAWLEKNGPSTEDKLMKWRIPKLSPTK